MKNKYNVKELEEKLDRCRNVNLGDVTLDDVDEISSIKIDKRKPSNERILEFITKVKNPYIFKVKGKLVIISFTDTDKTAEDCLTNVLKNLYKCIQRVNFFKLFKKYSTSLSDFIVFLAQEFKLNCFL